MESAFSYIAGLVEAFEDVGKGKQNEKNEPSWSQGAIPSCNINMANSTEDYCGAFGADLEQNAIASSFEDEGDDDAIRQSASMPSISEKKSFTEKLKSKRSNLANRLSILQSFSATSSNRNPPDVTKSRSSLSNTTKDSSTDVENDQTDFSWANSLSSNSGDDDERRRKHKYLPPPPSNPHLHWFAHGVLWTCMAIAFGWMGVGFSYAARVSPSFVETREPMYLDPRYETIPGVGMIHMELCFNQTHLSILEELNDNGFLLEGEKLELGAQSRTRSSHSFIKYDDDDDDDDIGPSVVDLATSPCIIHRLTSDDVHDDVLYQLSRSMAFLAMLLGGFLTACITLSVFWKTINLRPIGAGLLVAYFMQSFTFLIFDSNLCKDNSGCVMSAGGTYSALASVCWILACAASARMEKKKIRKEEKEEAAVEEEQWKRRLRHRVHPRDIVVQQETQPRVSEERRAIQKKSPTKPKRIAKEHRASTAETANIDSDDDSDSISEGNEKILQDLNEFNADPIYIPALPEISPSSERSMKKKNDSDKIDNPDVEKSKKSRAKKSESKGKKNQTQNVEDVTTSSSSSTSEKTKSSKRKSKSSKALQAQERSRSPSKSIDMAGDVVDTTLGDKLKKSKRVSERKIDDNASSRSRRSISSSRPRNVPPMRARPLSPSLRQSIAEGKKYEL